VPPVCIPTLSFGEVKVARDDVRFVQAFEHHWKGAESLHHLGLALISRTARSLNLGITAD
jgi:hypothetical protein